MSAAATAATLFDEFDLADDTDTTRRGADAPDPFDDAATYEFRWDVEVPDGERKYGQKFMKQWRRVLQAQRMTPLLSGKLAPLRARFQLLVEGEGEGTTVEQRSAEIVSELAHLRWACPAPEENIEGEPAARHPAGWQGVRVWIAFARQDVESALGKKAKI